VDLSRKSVSMRMPVIKRAPGLAPKAGAAPLNVRLQLLRQRRRRRIVRRFLVGAFWSAGLLCAMAFALAAGIGLVAR
jgi:hypothetical protein